MTPIRSRFHPLRFGLGLAVWFAAIALIAGPLFVPGLIPLSGFGLKYPVLAAPLYTLLAWGVLTFLGVVWISGLPRACEPEPLLHEASKRPRHGWWILAATAGLLATCAPAWRADFNFDDLFLFRGFTPAELLSTWTGTWDPNHALRVAYRPLFSWWSGTAHAIVGEHPWVHRVLNSVLFAIGMGLWFSRLLGPRLDRRVLWLLLPLALSSNAMSLFVGYAIEGFRAIHLLLLLGVLACVEQAAAAHQAHPHGNPWKTQGLAAGGLGLYVSALLLREEAVPLAPWFAGILWLGFRPARGSSRVREVARAWLSPRVLAWPGLFLAAPVVYVALRAHFTPTDEALRPLGLVRLLGTALASFPLVGLPLLALVGYGWWTQPGFRPRLALWLGLAVFCALPGVGMDRVDVAVYSLLFLLTAAGPGLLGLVNAIPARLPLVLSLLLANQVMGIFANWARMEDLRPHSLADIRRNNQVLHGFLHDRGAVVPEIRRARLEQRYAAMGFSPDKRFAAQVEAAWEQAASDGRFLHDSSLRPYRHAWDYLSSKPSVTGLARLNLARYRVENTSP